MHYRLVSIICMVIAAAGAVQAQPMSLEDLVSLKQVTEVRMSPDGTRIAYLLRSPRELYVEDDGPPHVELHVVSVEGERRPYVTGAIEITDLAWSANAASIFFLAKRDPEAEFNTLYRIPVAGGEAESVYSHVNDIKSVHPSPDGRRVAFVATDAPPDSDSELETRGFKALIYEESVLPKDVWLLDLETGAVAAQGLAGSASDLTWSKSGNRYAVALAPTPLVDDSYVARDIYVVNPATGRIVSEIGSVGKLGYFAFSPDGERIAYIGSVDINDPREGRLYLASVNGSERRDLVPGYPGHIKSLAWQDDVSLRWLGGRGVWTEWQTVATATSAQAGAAPTSGPIVREVHGHAGQDVVAAIADTPEHPPEVYLLGNGAEPVRLTDSNPWLADRRLAKQEVIRYEARDGLELEAILVRPFETERGGNPLIVVAHGGPESHFSNGWLARYVSPAHTLAADGYALVFPNYRGGTGRGVEFSKLSQNDYADEEFNDLVDAKRHLVTTGLVDGDRVGITGASYGGYASMWGASALTDEYAAAVAFVGISNQLSKFGTGDIPYEMFHVHSRTWPWDDWMWMLERSPIYHAGKARTPLLIMHGDSDPRVHPAQSLEMYRAMKIRTDTPVRLVLYPGEKHGNRNAAAQYDYALRMKRWMDHYLKRPGGEPPPYELDHASRLEAVAAD